MPVLNTNNARDLFALDAMTYAELKEQELRPTVGRGQDEQENQHIGQQRGGHARYWYQTRYGGKVSVCATQLKRLEQDKVIDAFTIIAKHSGRQTQGGFGLEAGDFSPYTIPLGAHQQVSKQWRAEVVSYARLMLDDWQPRSCYLVVCVYFASGAEETIATIERFRPELLKLK